MPDDLKLDGEDGDAENEENDENPFETQELKGGFQIIFSYSKN